MLFSKIAEDSVCNTPALFRSPCLIAAISSIGSCTNFDAPLKATFVDESTSHGLVNCPVTLPSDSNIMANGKPGGNYGNNFLSVGLWPDGHILFRKGRAGVVQPDGSLSMKLWWWRLVPGQLELGGRRLDDVALPMRAAIPDAYGEVGFQAISLIFPTIGCWEVTGRVGEGELIFVAYVSKTY